MHYAQVARAGLDVPFQITVQRRGGFGRGVTIAVVTTLVAIQVAATTKAAPVDTSVHTTPTAADETKSPSD